MTVFGAARTLQLRVFLFIAAGIGSLLALLGLVQVVGDPEPFTVIALVIGVLAAGTALAAVRTLPDRSRASRSICAAAGLVQVLLGLLLVRSAVGLVPLVVGILLIMLALLREAPEPP